LTGATYNFDPPTRADYVLSAPYWVTTSDGDVDATSYAVDADLTVYAYWLPLHTVTYNLNGGNVGGVTDAIVETDVIDGTLVGAAQPLFTPVRTDYIWTTPYWVTTAQGSTANFQWRKES
jgi:hypothetical protein